MKPLLRILHHLLARTRYHAWQTGEVVTSHPDGTFDVVIDGAHLQRVPFSPSLPADVKAPPGTPCLVCYAAGSPAHPRIVAFGAAGQRVSISGGARPFARVGDTVQPLWPPGAEITGFPVTGVVEGEVMIPGTPPVIVPLPKTPFVGTATPSPGLLPGKGIIQGGNSKFTG